MFEQFLEKHSLVRVGMACLSRKPLSFILPLAALLKGLLSVSQYNSSQLQEKCIIVYQYNNEKKALEKILEQKDNSYGSFFKIEYYRLHSDLIEWMLASLKFTKIRQLLRIGKRLYSKNSFLVATRQTHFLVAYSYSLHLFSQRNVSSKIFLASSESNPDILGPVLAAKSLGARTGYTNHGQLDRELGLFYFDYYIITGHSIRDRILESNQQILNAYYLQSPSPKKFILPRSDMIRNILIIGSIVLDLDACKKLFEQIRVQLPLAKITLRLHPNPQLLPAAIAPQIPDWVNLHDGKLPLLTEFKDIDLAIGGETSTHIEALEEGLPSIYWRIDGSPFDHYGFVERKLIPHLVDFKSLDEELNRIYLSPDWSKIFSYFSNQEPPKLSLKSFLRS